MRKFYLLGALVVTILLGGNVYAQDHPSGRDPITSTHDGPTAPVVSCEIPRPFIPCNYIVNNTYSPASSYVSALHRRDPFNINDPANPSLSLINEWRASHGTPQIYDNGQNPFITDPPPFPNSGYAKMGSFNDAGISEGEGIIQKIPALEAEKKYALSFFKKRENSSLAVDNFRIVLMYCENSASFNNNDYLTPQIPSGSQVIYCETQILNTNWEQVFISFTANANYDMIWMFPEQNLINFPSEAFVLFSFPEIIDISNFSAGPEPNPTTGNCTVTIGPTSPNCSVKNAVFTWQGPGALPPITAPPNQQIQIDAGNSQNVGTWTLSMTIPGVTITNSACGTQPPVIEATVNVRECSSWPKVYNSMDGIFSLTKVNNGDIVFSTNAALVNSTAYNHFGVFSSNPSLGALSIHYTSNGVTNWLDHSFYTGFALQSGTVQMLDFANGYYFVNGSTGVIAPPPFNLSPFETIIAETTTGNIITIDADLIRVRTINGVLTQVSLNGETNPLTRFNKGTNDLFVITAGIPGVCTLKIYHFDGSNLLLTASRTTNLPINSLVTVDGQNKLYFIDSDQILKQYDYLNPAQNVSINVIIPGFNNNMINLPCYSNQILHEWYENDKCVVQSNNTLYYLNFGTNISKSISANIGFCFALIDGNSVYLAGQLPSGPGNYQIGNQIFPLPVGGYSVPIFITKLNLEADFLRPEPINLISQKTFLEPSFSFEISPNPVSTSLNLEIFQKENSLSPTFRVIISGQMGKPELIKEGYTSGTGINIGNLRSGVYFITVINKSGERKSTTFLKL